MTIGDLITQVLPRVGSIQNKNNPAGITFLGAVNTIVSLIAKNMLSRHSDLLANGDLAVTIPAMGYYGTLPSDFLAPAERPQAEELYTEWMAGTVTSYNSISGALVMNVTNASGSAALSSWQIATASLPGLPAEIIGTSVTTLTPGTGSKSLTITTGLSLTAGTFIIVFTDDYPDPWIPRRKMIEPRYLLEDEENEDGSWWDDFGVYDTSLAIRPSYYKVISSTIYTRPKTTVGVTIKGKYFKQPALITDTDLDQALPWDGKFDQLFVEGVVLIITNGLAVPDADQAFMVLFNREFSMLMDARVRTLPFRRMKRGQFL